jgi:hypothetical protein
MLAKQAYVYLLYLRIGLRDTPLSTKVGTKFRRQVAQSVQFACGLRATEFVYELGWIRTKSNIPVTIYWPVVPALDDR